MSDTWTKGKGDDRVPDRRAYADRGCTVRGNSQGYLGPEGQRRGGHQPEGLAVFFLSALALSASKHDLEEGHALRAGRTICGLGMERRIRAERNEDVPGSWALFCVYGCLGRQ